MMCAMTLLKIYLLLSTLLCATAIFIPDSDDSIDGEAIEILEGLTGDAQLIKLLNNTGEGNLSVTNNIPTIRSRRSVKKRKNHHRRMNNRKRAHHRKRLLQSDPSHRQFALAVEKFLNQVPDVSAVTKPWIVYARVSYDLNDCFDLSINVTANPDKTAKSRLIYIGNDNTPDNTHDTTARQVHRRPFKTILVRRSIPDSMKNIPMEISSSTTTTTTTTTDDPTDEFTPELMDPIVYDTNSPDYYLVRMTKYIETNEVFLDLSILKRYARKFPLPTGSRTIISHVNGQDFLIMDHSNGSRLFFNVDH